MLSSLFGKSEPVSDNKSSANEKYILESWEKYYNEYKQYYPRKTILDSFFHSGLSSIVPEPPHTRYCRASDYVIDKQNREDFDLVRPLLEDDFRNLAATFEENAFKTCYQSGFIHTRDIFRFKLPADSPKFAGHEYGVITAAYVFEGMKKYFTRPFTCSLVCDSVDHEAFHFQVQFIQTPDQTV